MITSAKRHETHAKIKVIESQKQQLLNQYPAPDNIEAVKNFLRSLSLPEKKNSGHVKDLSSNESSFKSNP